MQTVSVREVQHHLSRYLRKVEKGEHIKITSRSRPVAVMSPFIECETDSIVDWSEHRQAITRIFRGRLVNGEKMETIVSEGRDRN